jgi:predicted HTH transcriptional regulator
MTLEELKSLLLVKTESRNLDFKEKFNWSSGDSDEKLKLVKDILAMANTPKGGSIVFGVRDADLQPVGLARVDFESFDQTTTNDFLHKYTDPRFSCQVHKFQADGRNHVVIEVSEFAEIPIICKSNANSSKDGKKLILKCGTLYIRTEKASSEAISSSEEMRELVGLALLKSGNNLLQRIQSLVDRPARSASEPDLHIDEPVRASAIPNLTIEKKA